MKEGDREEGKRDNKESGVILSSIYLKTMG